MKSTVERPIEEKPSEANVKESERPPELNKTPPPFPPRAVQIGRHWKLLIVLLTLVVIMIIVFVLPNSFLPFFS